MFILSHQQINGVGNIAQQENHTLGTVKLFLFERVGHNKCGYRCAYHHHKVDGVDSLHMDRRDRCRETENHENVEHIAT